MFLFVVIKQVTTYRTVKQYDYYFSKKLNLTENESKIALREVDDKMHKILSLRIALQKLLLH